MLAQTSASRSLCAWLLAAVLTGPLLGVLTVIFATIWDVYSNVSRPFSHYAVVVPIAIVVMSIGSIVIGAICVLPTCPLGWAGLYVLTKIKSPYRYACSAAMILLGAVAMAVFYDYFVPSYRFMLGESPDWEHGLSAERFMAALFIYSVIFLIAICILRASDASFFESRRGFEHTS